MKKYYFLASVKQTYSLLTRCIFREKKILAYTLKSEILFCLIEIYYAAKNA